MTTVKNKSTIENNASPINKQTQKHVPSLIYQTSLATQNKDQKTVIQNRHLLDQIPNTFYEKNLLKYFILYSINLKMQKMVTLLATFNKT